MSDDGYLVLPESLPIDSVVDEAEFTDVTEAGEVYTLYRIVRFTHEALDTRAHWTHIANVTRVRKPAIGVAHLRVANRTIEDSMVTLTPTVE